MSPLPQFRENTMRNEATPMNPNAADAEWPVDGVEEDLDDELDTAAELHRLAAHHFAAAAKYHLLAATADDEGDNEANARYAHLAYRHQLNGTQYAEIAVMDNESLEEDEGV
jgi:hypothetical protein